MKTGDILLARSCTPGGRLVHWLTNSRWNHCGLVVCFQDGKIVEDGPDVQILEAVNPDGVRYTPLERFCSFYHEISICCKNQKWDLDNFSTIVDSMIGKPFPSWLELASSVWNSPSNERIYCSQLIAEIYAQMGVSLDGKYPHRLAEKSSLQPFYFREEDYLTSWTGLIIGLLTIIILIGTWFLTPNYQTDPHDMWDRRWQPYVEFRHAR